MREFRFTRAAAFAAGGWAFDLPTLHGVLDTLLCVVCASRFHGVSINGAAYRIQGYRKGPPEWACRLGVQLSERPSLRACERLARPAYRCDGRMLDTLASVDVEIRGVVAIITGDVDRSIVAEECVSHFVSTFSIQ